MGFSKFATMKLNPLWVGAWFVALFCAFFGCSTEVETVNVSANKTVSIIDDSETFSQFECSEENAGRLAYVESEDIVYYCVDEMWRRLSGIDGKDGTDGIDGANGVNGVRGKNGETGSDCRMEQTRRGYKLICGNTSATVFLNMDIPDTCSIQADGDSAYVLSCGDNSYQVMQGYVGEDGSDCIQENLGNGYVRLVCGEDTLLNAKAMCGETAYDPDGDLFCSSGTLLERCAGQIYDYPREVCVDDVIHKLCGDSLYDELNNVCIDEMIYPLCEGDIYDTSKFTCEDDVLYAMCDTVRFAYKTHLCYMGRVYEKYMDERDGTIYRLVEIGNQTWFAENLDWETETSRCYQDQDSNCVIYGRLYSWQEALDACPEGFHLPLKSEYDSLLAYVGRTYGSSSYTLQSTAYWSTKYTSVKNQAGFDGLPGGYLLSSGYSNVGIYGFFWTSENYTSSNSLAYVFRLAYSSQAFASLTKTYYASVRCLKDGI